MYIYTDVYMHTLLYEYLNDSEALHVLCSSAEFDQLKVYIYEYMCLNMYIYVYLYRCIHAYIII
jgi:hypothetical protein